MDGFGDCAICGKPIESGVVVVADDVARRAHGQCWIDAGKTIVGPEELLQMLGEAALPPVDAVRANQ